MSSFSKTLVQIFGDKVMERCEIIEVNAIMFGYDIDVIHFADESNGYRIFFEQQKKIEFYVNIDANESGIVTISKTAREKLKNNTTREDGLLSRIEKLL